jgi:hypothetical protein
MQYSKVSCAQCVHYQKCPQKTRMYINYCGSDFKRIEKKIATAVIECRARRGLLFTRNILSPGSSRLKKVTLSTAVS